MKQRSKSSSVWIRRSRNAIVEGHFRVGFVILAVVFGGSPRLEGCGATPKAFRLESLGVGRAPIIFMNEGGPILVDADGPADTREQTAGVVGTGVVTSTWAK